MAGKNWWFWLATVVLIGAIAVITVFEVLTPFETLENSHPALLMWLGSILWATVSVALLRSGYQEWEADPIIWGLLFSAITILSVSGIFVVRLTFLASIINAAGWLLFLVFMVYGHPVLVEQRERKIFEKVKKDWQKKRRYGY